MSVRHRCSACYKQYKKKDHLLAHMKTSCHSVHDPKCGVCNKHCKSFESLREHIGGQLLCLDYECALGVNVLFAILPKFYVRCNI